MKSYKAYVQAAEQAFETAPTGKKVWASLVSIVSAVSLSALVLWTAFTFFLPLGGGFFRVDGASMDPTLHDGQYIFVDNTPIVRGDIVTSTIPDAMLDRYPDKEGVILVKRVIGLPGETLRFEENDVYIDGVLLQEDYLTEEIRQKTMIDGMKTSITLSENQYFLLGDNRAVSFDSRYFGAVETENLVSKTSLTITTASIPYFLALALVIAICVGLYCLADPFITYWILVYRQRKPEENRQPEP